MRAYAASGRPCRGTAGRWRRRACRGPERQTYSDPDACRVWGALSGRSMSAFQDSAFMLPTDRSINPIVRGSGVSSDTRPWPQREMGAGIPPCPLAVVSDSWFPPLPFARGSLAVNLDPSRLPSEAILSPRPVAARRTATRPPPRTGRRRGRGSAGRCREGRVQEPLRSASATSCRNSSTVSLPNLTSRPCSWAISCSRS